MGFQQINREITEGLIYFNPHIKGIRWGYHKGRQVDRKIKTKERKKTAKDRGERCRL